MAFVKDNLPQLSTLPVQNAISTQVTTLVNGTLNVLQDAALSLFNSPDQLLSQIDKGILFVPTITQSEIQLTDGFSKVLFAATIATAWSMGDEPPVPVIM